MKKTLLIIGLVAVGLFMVYNNRSTADLILYSGRSKALVDPIIERFEQETGLRVEVRYGGTTQLAVALMEEGVRTPADVFWAQDAGALGALSQSGMFRTLPDDIIQMVPYRYASAQNLWVATSGRARVMAYSTTRVNPENLPSSIFDLTNDRWAGRIAWAPTNGSFQAFVSAMLQEYGPQTTREWLEGVKNNGAKNYANNNAILQGIASGETDLGITNHYYLLRSRVGDPRFPVENAFFRDGDIGNMINIAGVGITTASQRTEAAETFIRFLLHEETQRWFTEETFEYATAGLSGTEIRTAYELSPEIDLGSLDNLQETLNLLREAGLL
ncbi:MAG: iron ABC transporter substrate-binding protein [Bacteroidetes bacterium]|nr:iron ABC transporter substrate-binding protein [Bacteroidota bacterium]MCH8523568.1 iron ABC transporter substrate-binding protein [Balneolales bacterium]